MVIVRHELFGRFGGAADLSNEPAIGWLIPNWLPSKEISIIFGQPGSYKSFIAQAWSLKLSLNGYKVMYIAAEGVSGLRARVGAWRAQILGNPMHDLPNWNYYDSNVWIDNNDHRRAWVEGCFEYLDGPPDLVVIDTLARCFTGDENSAQHMGMFIYGVERLRRELGCAVLIVHHMGLSTGRERGTAALRAASFAMFKTSDPRSREDGGSVLFACDRMKDGSKPDKKRLEFVRVGLDVNEHGEVFDYSLALKNFI